MLTDEFAYWLAVDRLEPIGDRGAYWRSAMLAALDANIHRSKKQKAHELTDYLPQSGLTKQVKSRALSERILSAFKGMKGKTG